MRKTRLTLAKALPVLLVVAGIIGLICSFVLTYDQIEILKNPQYVPSCNLNPVLSCGSVINSKESEVLGLPNPVFGLAAFGALTTIGVALLAGANFKRWFWLGLETGTVAGLAFVHWLFFQSVYRINALCPFCIVVWAVVITTFWYVTLYNVEQGYIRLPQGHLQTAAVWARRHHIDILLMWFIIIAVLILKHFWYYYGKYL